MKEINIITSESKDRIFTDAFIDNYCTIDLPSLPDDYGDRLKTFTKNFRAWMKKQEKIKNKKEN